MSQREIMKRSAAQQAAQWDDEEEPITLENQSELCEQITGIETLVNQLNARQARIENQLIHLTPSAKKAEQQFATLVLAGKELCEEIEQQRKELATNLGQHTEQVTARAGQIKSEFNRQYKMLQEFYNEMVKMNEKNEQMIGQCQNMVATSSAVYHKGSSGVKEISEKTQAHLKVATQEHCKEIEVQAQHFKTIYMRLSKLLIIGTIVILLSALIAGAIAGLMTARYRQLQEQEDTNSPTR